MLKVKKPSYKSVNRAGSNMHEGTFARRVEIALRDIFARKQICTKIFMIGGKNRE